MVTTTEDCKGCRYSGRKGFPDSPCSACRNQYADSYVPQQGELKPELEGGCGKCSFEISRAKRCEKCARNYPVGFEAIPPSKPLSPAEVIAYQQLLRVASIGRKGLLRPGPRY